MIDIYAVLFVVGQFDLNLVYSSFCTAFKI